MAEIERRVFDADLLKVESREDGEPKKIVGHAAVFDTWTELFDGFEERIAAGAFAESIKDDDVRSLFNHDPNFVLGRNKAGTLTLREDKTGLYTETTPPDTSFARDLAVSIARGDISQMSFAFRTVKDSVEYDRESDIVRRTVEKVKLYDVSPVTFPAYPTTDVGMRGMEEARKAVEQCLRNKPTPIRNRFRARLEMWRSAFGFAAK